MNRKTRHLFSQISSIRDYGNDFIQAQLDENGLDDLRPSHGALYAILKRSNSGLGVTEIARRMERSKSTVSVMIRGLEKKGYLMKVPAEKGLEKKIKLTSAFIALEPVFEEISRKLLEKAYGSMAQEKQEMLMALLEDVKNNLSEKK